MQEIMTSLLAYVNDFWRFRWSAMIAAWLIAIGGWVAVTVLPDEYEATARVYVDTDGMLRPLLKGLAAETTDLSDRLGLMTRKLLSRPNLEQIARMTDLDIWAQTNIEREALLDKLRDSIRLRGISASQIKRRNAAPDLYEISAIHRDPQTAKKIVQSLLTVFVEDSLGDTRQNSEVAQNFLDEQIKEYEARLTDAEDRLREYKRKHIDVLPEQGRSYFQRLSDAQTKVEEAELEMREAVYRRDELARQLSEAEKAGQAASKDDPTLRSPVDERILALQTKLDELLLKYTEEHPDVIELKESIAALERQRIDPMPSEKNLAINPVYQQIKIALGEAEATLAAIRVRKEEYAARVAKLQEHVETLPKVEAELQRLNRDYEVHRENYTTLVARRESAKMAEEVENTGEQVKFQVIDPPRVPIKPSAPNRPLLSSAVLGGALGGSIALALLLAQLRPVFYESQTLGEVSGFPVFGGVSMTWSPKMLVRKRIGVAAYIVCGVLLLAAFGTVVFLQMTDSGIVQMLQQLRESI